LILHPVALLLLPALSKSILLAASNPRQLTNSMPGVFPMAEDNIIQSMVIEGGGLPRPSSAFRRASPRR
jgi:hypothetical protein